MNNTTLTHDDCLALLRAERRQDRTIAERFVTACRDGSVSDLQEAAAALDGESANGWVIALRKIVKMRLSVTPEIQQAFFRLWVEHKSIRLSVGDDLMLISALRLLCPPYEGKAARLFRGALADERRRRLYGLSWTTSIDIAERFAERTPDLYERIVIETHAPAEAIIAKVDYPEPLTPAEVQKINRDHPGVIINQYHKESEYLLDRRRLMSVKVVRRYPAASATLDT